MSVKIEIDSHSYIKVETTKMSFAADSLQPKTHTHVIVETVEAFFTFPDGLVEFTRDGKGTGQKLVAGGVKVLFTSKDGGAWQADPWSVSVDAFNLKKDGTPGAKANMHDVWTPDWAKALVEKDGDGRTDAYDWIRAEYSR